MSDSGGILILQRPASLPSSALLNGGSAATAVPLRRKLGSSTSARQSSKKALWALTKPVGTPTVDPESFLTPADYERPAPCTTPGAPRRKKACKGCTCGLAEIEAAEAEGKNIILIDGAPDGGARESTPQENERARLMAAAAAAPKATSSCGNCFMGDAFRCDGCPYLGTSFRELSVSYSTRG